MEWPAKKACVLDCVCASSMWSVRFAPGTFVRGLRTGVCVHMCLLWTRQPWGSFRPEARDDHCPVQWKESTWRWQQHRGKESREMQNGVRLLTTPDAWTQLCPKSEVNLDVSVTTTMNSFLFLKQIDRCCCCLRLQWSCYYTLLHLIWTPNGEVNAYLG